MMAMAGAETSQKYGAVRGAAEPTAAVQVPPFARVLIELLAKRWNGTLLIRAEDGEHEAAVRFEEGFAVAAKVDAPSATLLQCLIPLCVWQHRRFEFLDREDGVGSGADVVTGQVDPLGLIAASVRGPIRDEVLEEAVTALGEEPFRLRPNVLLSRYGFTAQELHAVACLQRGSITVAQLRERAQVPEHALRRVLYVLWVTHALSLLMSPRRVVSGTIRQPAPPPLPSQRVQADLSGVQLPPMPSMPSMPPEDLTGVTVEMPNVDEHARGSSVPPTRAPLRSDVAPSPRGRYHVQNPQNGVSAVDARVRSIPPIIESLLRATNRPRPSSAPPSRRSQPPQASRSMEPGRMATPPRAPSRTAPPGERIRPAVESAPIVSERVRQAFASSPPAHESLPAAYESEPPIAIAIESEPPIAIESEPPAYESEPPLASAPPRISPPPLHSSAPAARSGEPVQDAKPTRSLKPVRQSPLTRSLKPVRPSQAPSAPAPDPGVKPTRSLKPVHPSAPPSDSLRSSAPPRASRPSAPRRPSQPGTTRSEGDQRFSLAEGLMRRGDYTAAITEMQEAMKLRGPRAADEALFAWMLYQQRGGGSEVPETSWQAIERAFRLDLHSDVAYHYKAMLLKREGRLAEARAHFRRALHLNPRNVDARRELRVLLMRKRDNQKQPSGLLNKIFGRTPVPK
jgi:tetratricopeptide (TPR) repeat protein